MKCKTEGHLSKLEPFGKLKYSQGIQTDVIYACCANILANLKAAKIDHLNPILFARQLYLLALLDYLNIGRLDRYLLW